MASSSRSVGLREPEPEEEAVGVGEAILMLLETEDGVVEEGEGGRSRGLH